MGKKRTYISSNLPTHMTIAGIRETYSFPDYIEARNYNNVSRYQTYRRIRSEDDNYVYHETINQDVIEQSDSDIFITVDNITENRLDKIALNYYGISVYWWIIALANNIIDPFTVPIGTVLRIPPISSLYDKGGVLFNG